MHLIGYFEDIDGMMDHLNSNLDDVDRQLVECILINPSVDEYTRIKSYVSKNSFGMTELRTTPKEYVSGFGGETDYDASTPMLVQFSPGYKPSEFDEYILDRFTNLCMLMDARTKGENENE